MEYLNMEKSGLITILIPLNFLIGEYTLFFRLNGWSRKIIHLITVVIDLLLKKGRILLGAILIIIELVGRMLYPSMFMGLPLITRIFSYIILAVLPIEIIVFNSFLVKKQNGMAI